MTKFPTAEKKDILPMLWNFLGVDPSAPLKTLRETVKQADPEEDLSTVISNYEELEFCFHLSDVTHFAKQRNARLGDSKPSNPQTVILPTSTGTENSWSIILPICSRPQSKQKTPVHSTESDVHENKKFDSNRFIDLALSSQYGDCDKVDEGTCWRMLEEFGQSLKETMTVEQADNTECIVGIDRDDSLYQGEKARERVSALLPCKARFVEIQPVMYGHVCKIWNFLASKAGNDFIVLLGDDVKVHDQGWQQRVVRNSENRGASYARNTGYNYSTADWVLFLDDDVIPQSEILDAYHGAILRYPDGKVYVGQTKLPEACGIWTQMLCTCNVGYFYGIAKEMVHPSRGVTANLMVRGSRFNSTIQFKTIYPRTGGGEDIDFVYQFKVWYKNLKRRVTVGVPEAIVTHPWWNSGNLCYGQISGWAVGDSLCITEWPEKTFLAFPNWVECIVFGLIPMTMVTGKVFVGTATILGVVILEHSIKSARYMGSACEVTGSNNPFYNIFVALGAGSVLSAQELTRVASLIRRGSFYSICCRVDWFDGQKETIKLDIQLGSLVRFLVTLDLIYVCFSFGRDTEKSVFHGVSSEDTSSVEL
jgi:glycosyltransferase involved in cell wall biosynthesis